MLKIFGFFLGIPVALMISIISFVGVKTYRNIEDAAVRATALENALSGPASNPPPSEAKSFRYGGRSAV